MCDALKQPVKLVSLWVKVPPAVQAGSTSKTEGAAAGVGEAHSKLKLEALDLRGLNEATRAYVHVEPSAKSRKKFHEHVRAQLNHWTLGRRVAEAMTELNRYLRGWSQYFHSAHGARVIGKLQWWTRDRLRRWLWRKHQQTKALWSDYPDELLHGRYGLWRMPTHPAWKTKRA